MILACGTLLASCQSKEQQILGKWNMHLVSNDGTDVTEEHNPENNRWIDFKDNGAYISDGDPYGKNSGKWSFNEEGFLFLDSDADEGDDSYWEVDISKNKMVWKGAVFEFTKTFSLEYRRAEDPT